MEGFFELDFFFSPTDPELLAVAENAAQVNRMGLSQSETEAAARSSEK